MKKILRIGDRIEVRRYAPFQGTLWIPATVEAVFSRTIGVRFDDGTCLFIRQEEWR